MAKIATVTVATKLRRALAPFALPAAEAATASVNFLKAAFSSEITLPSAVGLSSFIETMLLSFAPESAFHAVIFFSPSARPFVSKITASFASAVQYASVVEVSLK